MALFSQAQYTSLVLAYIEGSGAKGATTAELEEWVRYCEDITVALALIHMVRDGEVGVYLDENDNYIFTPKGEVN